MNDSDRDELTRRAIRVAYVVLRFPSLSETFVAREIAGLRDLGWDVPIYPLRRDNPDTIHDLVRPLIPAVRWKAPLSRAVAAANVRMLVRQPLRYLSTFAFVASDVARSPKRGLKSVAAFPTMVWMAWDMQMRGVQHVHAHFASYPALAALVAKRLTGVRYSITAHAYDVYVKPLRLREKVRHAEFVIAISAYNRGLIAESVGTATPVHVVHCGVAVPDQCPGASVVQGHILSVGRLEEKKGHRILIDACRMLRDRGLDFRCTIVGGGPLAARLQRQIDEHRLTDVVTLTGPRTAEEVMSELTRATVFALPSVVTADGNADGIPVALMEAMAAGVPVVSTAVTGIPELIEHRVSGLLVEPNDASSLADAIQELLSDSALRDAFRQAGYERVANHFHLKSCVLDVARHIAQTVSS